MKLLLWVILGLLIEGCSTHQHAHPTIVKTSNPVKKKAVSTGEKEAVWELLSHSQIVLEFRNLDNDSILSVNLQRGLTRKTIQKGHWELVGFVNGGTSFSSMNVSKKFVFRVRPDSNTYAGSVVIGCPRIASSDFKLLKGMSFFNRYPFSSSSGLCEVAVGSDFAKVRSHLRKSKKSNRLNLVIGF